MLYSFQDRHIQEFFIENSYPERSLIQAVYEFLISREEDPIELTLEEIRDRLGLSVSPEAIGSCLQVLARTDVLDRLETGGGLAVVKLDSQLPTLVDLLPREAKVQRQVLRALEKIVGDRRGEQVFFHPRWLLQQADLPRDAVQRALRELGRLEEFDYIPPFRGRAVHLRTRDVPFGDLNIDFAAIQRRKEAEYDRLNRVSQYAQSPLCRQANILQYFGDESADHCGRCDRCGRTVGWPVMPKTKSATGEETPNSITPTPAATSPALAAILEEVVDAIQRIHGRLGKHLIAQYLCGSQNAKVQKLKLHRLSGFGLLGSLKQADGVALLDALLAAGALRQQEVNRNRPTLSVAPEIMQAERRRHVLTGVQVDGKLNSKLEKIARSRPGSGTAQPATVARSQTEPTVTKHQGVPPEPEDLFGARDSSHRPESDRPLAEAKKDPNRQLTNTHPGDDASHASQPKSSETRASEVSNNSETGGADWNWTVHLFEQGHNWETVRTIRRMKDEELAASLCVALRQGAKLSRKWFSPPDDTPRTSGQQRVLREVRRREAAGVA